MLECHLYQPDAVSLTEPPLRQASRPWKHSPSQPCTSFGNAAERNPQGWMCRFLPICGFWEHISTISKRLG